MNNKTKKNKTTTQVYTQPIYGIKQVIVVVSNDMNSLKKYIDKSIDLNRYTNADGLTFNNVTYKNKSSVCIYLHPSEFSDSIDNVSAHESFHAASAILDCAGVKLCSNSEEAFAYLVGWINECVIKTYYKWLKK